MRIVPARYAVECEAERKKKEGKVLPEQSESLERTRKEKWQS